MNWEAPLRADARLAVRNAVKIRAALRNSLNSDTIYEAYLATQPHATGNLAQDRVRARAWAMINVRLNLEAFKLILLRIWATGYLIGELAAGEVVEAEMQTQNKSSMINKKDTDQEEEPRIGMTINWDTWEPGDRITAMLLKPKKGLQRLLSDQNVRIKDMTATTLNDLGNALGEAVAVGMSARQAAKHIKKTLAHPSRALMIAITESNRAMTFAAMERYQDFGINQTQWLVFDPCDICAKNAGQIAAMGTPFPSNHLRPPAHPNCRCTIAPVLPDFTLGKHLPGRHDQQTHAGGRGGVETLQIPESQNWTTEQEKTAEEKYEKEYAPQQGLEPETVEAVKGYAGNGYVAINGYLRGQEYPEMYEEEMMDFMISDLDNAILDAPNLVGDTNLYRVFDNQVLENLQEGDTLIDKGFLSTTRIDITAGENSTTRLELGNISASHDTVAVILPNSKKNGVGLLVDQYLSAQGEIITPSAEREKEVLLPRETPLTFLGFAEGELERIAIFERA